MLLTINIFKNKIILHESIIYRIKKEFVIPLYLLAENKEYFIRNLNRNNLIHLSLYLNNINHIKQGLRENDILLNEIIQYL